MFAQWEVITISILTFLLGARCGVKLQERISKNIRLKSIPPANDKYIPDDPKYH